jgi:hypothetical protein
MENKMTRYVSLEQAAFDFRVSAKQLVKITGEGGEFPLCKRAGTLYYDSTELEAKFRWRKSRSQRAREIPFVLLSFQTPIRPSPTVRCAKSTIVLDSVKYPLRNRCMKTETLIRRLARS